MNFFYFHSRYIITVTTLAIETFTVYCSVTSRHTTTPIIIPTIFHSTSIRLKCRSFFSSGFVASSIIAHRMTAILIHNDMNKDRNIRTVKNPMCAPVRMICSFRCRCSDRVLLSAPNALPFWWLRYTSMMNKTLNRIIFISTISLTDI